MKIIDNSINKLPDSMTFNDHLEEFRQRILNSIQESNSVLSILILRNQRMKVLHLPSGIVLISSDFLKATLSAQTLITLLKNELPKAYDRDPLQILINQQSIHHLLRFILGFESQLELKSVNGFLRPIPPTLQNHNIKLDDFSWVALQNACLN